MAWSDEALEKRRQTIEERKRFQRDDVLILRRRGMVPYIDFESAKR